VGIFSNKIVPPPPPDGYCDLHAHLLPGVDDGSPDWDTTRSILDHLAEVGFCCVAATPHTYDSPHSIDESKIAEIRAILQQECIGRGLSVVDAAEYYLDFQFHQFLTEKRPLTFSTSSPYFLCELPMTPVLDYLDNLAFTIRLNDLRPVLAHPERYFFIPFKVKSYEHLRELGFLLQINLGSFVGYYGRQARKRAEKMLKWGMVDLLATDIHSLSQSKEILPEAFARVTKLAGEETLYRLLSATPLALRAGDKPAPQLTV
jgi:protein-tyrosine phosphatase